MSRITVGDRYEAPPGVLEELDDPSSALSGQGVEFNERSIGLRFDDVAPGARMEVYNRFPQRPRSFLEYQEARLWVTPAEGPFAPDQPLYFFFKVGSDTDNFYLYRTPLRTPSPGSTSSAKYGVIAGARRIARSCFRPATKVCLSVCVDK